MLIRECCTKRIQIHFVSFRPATRPSSIRDAPWNPSIFTSTLTKLVAPVKAQAYGLCSHHHILELGGT